MNNNWENSWNAKKITKETIEQLDISTVNKEILVKHLDLLRAYHEVPVNIIVFFDSVIAYYGLIFMFELFAHFVKNGIIELDEVVNN